MPHTLRSAKVEDAKGIAKVHIDTWRECYKGVVPDSYLDNLDLLQRRKGWEYILAHSDQSCFVLEQNQSVFGWVTCGTNRDDLGDDICEIYGIYVLPEYWGTDAGLQLFDAAMDKLAARSPKRVTLWVLKENTRAQRFYEKQGFMNDGATKLVDIGGKNLEEIRYEKLVR
jgi:ribosomal protein S18 acetylase RimI-like enzyme